MNYSSINPFLAPLNKCLHLKSVNLGTLSRFLYIKNWHDFSLVNIKINSEQGGSDERSYFAKTSVTRVCNSY